MSGAAYLAETDPGRLSALEALVRASGARAPERIASAADLARVLARDQPALLLLGADFPGAAEALSARASRRAWVTLLSEPGRAPPPALWRSADDVLFLPAAPHDLELLWSRAVRALALACEREAHDDQGPSLWDAGESPAARRLQEQLERVVGAPDTTVLILGPAGAGKEALARRIHRRSRRRDAAFLCVRCRRPAPELERVLFGDELLPGGVLAAPSAGSLLLDEVGALPLAVQDRIAALLAARAAGDAGRERLPRLLAATERSLDAEVSAGRFREELFYRLNVLSIAVPPLCSAHGDAGRLAQACLRAAGRGGRRVPSLSEAALRLLDGHDWPGNQRELLHTLERALLLADAGPLLPAHLGFAQQDSGADLAPQLSLADRSLRALEEALIRRVLEEEAGNRSRVARILGINRTTLYNKLKSYGIEDAPTGSG